MYLEVKLVLEGEVFALEYVLKEFVNYFSCGPHTSVFVVECC